MRLIYNKRQENKLLPLLITIAMYHFILKYFIMKCRSKYICPQAKKQ